MLTVGLGEDTANLIRLPSILSNGSSFAALTSVAALGASPGADGADSAGDLADALSSSNTAR